MASSSSGRALVPHVRDQETTMTDRRYATPEPTLPSHDAIRAEKQDTIESAVRTIRRVHHVGEASGYAILVQASVDARSSVRDAADGILAASR
jgi:hypothetical protein